MNALVYDSDRKFLFVGGVMVALVWSLLFFQADMRSITHLWGYNALSGFLATHDLRWYQSYCVFLLVLVLRPGDVRLYYGALFGAFLLVALPVAMFNDSFKPAFVLDGFESPKDKPGKAAVSEGVPIYGANGTRWAEIVDKLAIDLNTQNKAFDQDMRKEGFFGQLDAGAFLSDPEASAARLKHMHNLIKIHRAKFAKIVADADAALQAEQKDAPSPLLKSYQDKARREGARIDEDMVYYEKIVSA
ncbi:MAG TPA: hypothetical protein VHM27_06435, partial [Rhizomicrobium sp.]|nr:hypothetical protein [Rhizomicrobium sp.]